MKDNRWKIILVLILTAISIYGIYPPKDKIRLGLDLKGGIHLLAQVQIEEALAEYTDRLIDRVKEDLTKNQIPFTSIVRASHSTFVVDGVPVDKQAQLKKAVESLQEWDLTITGTKAVASLRQAVITRRTEDAVTQSIKIMRERVNRYGVTEPIVQRQGLTGSRIIIQLPGVEDSERLMVILKGAAKLDLKLVTAGPTATPDALPGVTNGQPPEGMEIAEHTRIEENGSSKTEYLLLQKQSIISGDELQAATRTADQYGRPAVDFTLKSAAGERFGSFTEANIGKNLAIVLDKKVQSFPTINSRITTNGIIEGQFTIEEATDLSVMLQSGALPATVSFLEQRVVGPSLGLDSIRKGVLACLIGMAIIVLFMIIYYKASGINAVVALSLNMLFLLALMCYFEATLTLPGIAGIVLTIGMAVDANVLIFERIKEDLQLGKTVRSAIQSGFAKAFLPILDSNVSTVIAAIMLYWFGTGPVKGFAVTLIIGLACSMFTAVFVSRLIFELVLSRRTKVETLSI